MQRFSDSLWGAYIIDGRVWGDSNRLNEVFDNLIVDACKQTETGGLTLSATQNNAIAILDDLGMPETLWVCRVKEFGPLIVSIDTEGSNLFERNKVIFIEKKQKATEAICKEVRFIK